MSPLIRSDVQLSTVASWQVGGSADFLAEPRTVEELREVVAWAAREGHPISVISGGTNVLISDQGVRGLVVLMKRFVGLSTEETDGRLKVTCLSGTSKSELLRTFLKHRLEPAHFLAGIPGDVGGGVAMNAGVREQLKPREFVELTDWIEVMRSDGAIERIEASSLHWSYRHCEGWRPGIITRVGLSWPLVPHPQILAEVKNANQARLSKQPLDLPNCGSVFVNPPGDSAGRLIESCGLKGFTVGGAQVSKKHANFIVNAGGAKASDIHRVIEHVKQTVRRDCGVDLRTEVVYLGDWASSLSETV